MSVSIFFYIQKFHSHFHSSLLKHVELRDEIRETRYEEQNLTSRNDINVLYISLPHSNPQKYI